MLAYVSAILPYTLPQLEVFCHFLRLLSQMGMREDLTVGKTNLILFLISRLPGWDTLGRSPHCTPIFMRSRA